MAEISGENLVPLGAAHSGAAYVLPNKNPNALALLVQGQKVREIAAHKEAGRQQKAAIDRGKEFTDRLKFNQSGSPYFSDSLTKEKYHPLMDKLTGIFKQYKDDSLNRNIESGRLLQDADNETKQAEGKTKYIDDQLRTLRGDSALYNVQYAGQHLAGALRREDGAGRLPSQFDEETWRTNLLGDQQLYNEGEVVARATKRIGHEVSQKISDAGGLGGQHAADTTRAKYVRMENGKPVLNADQTPALDLTPELQSEFESDPLVKLKLDAHEAAYNAKREADPALPNMTRRGHLAQMVGPFAYYSTSHDEGINPLPRVPRAAREAKPTDVLATPTVTGQTSYYRDGASTATTPNHYAAVGHSFGSAAHPYVPVEVNNNALEVVGKDGEPTHPNLLGTNGRTQVQLQGRDYVLFANGKRLGRPEPFQTDAESYQEAMRLIKESPHPERLELRVMGRGTVVDKSKVAGDGLGGAPQIIGYDRQHGNKPIYDTSTTETQHTVNFPITQDIDAALERATKNKWHHHKASPQEKELTRAVQQRGGKLITPYNGQVSARPQPVGPTTRPAFLPAKMPATKAPTPEPQKADDKSGGML